MIIGIGTDIVQRARIERLLQRFGKRFLDRILSVEERLIFEKSTLPIAFLAKRFAAKEAVAKALGVGIGAHLAFNQISITNHQNGKPRVCFLEKAHQYVRKLGDLAVHISLSDEKHYALAFVVITSSNASS